MAETPMETDDQPLQPTLYVPPIPDNYLLNELLLKIGKYITDDVLRRIKFKYADEFEAHISAGIQSPEDLFAILKQRRYITPENMFHLQAIVMMIDDDDVEVELMEQIYEYSRRHNAVFFRKSTDEPPNGFRRLQLHVEGVEHYQYDSNAVNNLIITVASLTGINIGDVLLDGIQLTHSIYVTLLIPDRHYILFSSLLKKGISLLTELKIDMVTFEDGTTINASHGSQIIEKLPPIRENPDETIQRLNEVIDGLELENIEFRKQIEDLTLPEGASDDLKAISRQFEEPMNEAIEKHSNHQLLQRIVSLNTRLVKGPESEKMKAKQKQLELGQLEHKHAGMLETSKLEDGEDDSGVGSNYATGNCEIVFTIYMNGAPTKMAEAPIETDAQPLQPRSTSREETSIVPKKPLEVPPILDDLPFNELLLEIGKHITCDVLGKIKFKYGGELKTRIRGEIQSPEDLFTKLMQRRYITPENMFHLQAIVMMIDDADAVVELMEQIYEYSRKHKAVFFRKSTDEPPNGFRRLQFHVEGVEHYQYDSNAVNKLRIAVASLTGINTGDVLLDGIQLTHSIYVTLLIPDRHYIMFSSLLKKGIPLLTELKIDMVTFEDKTTINEPKNRSSAQTTSGGSDSPVQNVENSHS